MVLSPSPSLCPEVACFVLCMLVGGWGGERDEVEETCLSSGVAAVMEMAGPFSHQWFKSNFG